jgi:RecJ-like exonuclease
MPRKILFALFLVIVVSFIVLDAVQVNCPQCEGKGSVRGYSRGSIVSLENVVLNYTTTACGYEWWDVTIYLKSNVERNLNVKVYVTPFDPKINKTYSRITWNVYVGAYENKSVSGTVTVPDLYGSLQHSDLRVLVDIAVEESAGEEFVSCPLCKGNGKVPLLDFIRFYFGGSR